MNFECSITSSQPPQYVSTLAWAASITDDKPVLKINSIYRFSKYLNLSAAARPDSAAVQSASSIFVLWNYFWISLIHYNIISMVLYSARLLVATPISLYFFTRDPDGFFFYLIERFQVLKFTFDTLLTQYYFLIITGTSLHKMAHKNRSLREDLITCWPS